MEVQKGPEEEVCECEVHSGVVRIQRKVPEAARDEDTTGCQPYDQQ